MTLARALIEKGAKVSLVGKIDPIHILQSFAHENVKFLKMEFSSISQEDDATLTRALVGKTPDWVIVDHYGLGADWEAVIKADGAQCLVLDDIPKRKHDCDILLDQNLRLKRRILDVSRNSRVKIFLQGPKYALLRPEFGILRERSIKNRHLRVPQRMFVCLGGGDVTDETVKVLKALMTHKARWPFVTVVMGSAATGLDHISAQLSEFKSGKLYVQPNNVAELMAEADCAITSSGSISWEKCCLGLPSIGLSIADNQNDTARALHEKGAQISTTIDQIPEALSKLTPKLLRNMSQRAAAICDGLGAMRVAGLMGKP